jgi:hypothetical protein
MQENNFYIRGLHIKSPEEWKQIFYISKEYGLSPRIVQELLYNTNNKDIYLCLTDEQQYAWNKYIMYILIN